MMLACQLQQTGEDAGTNDTEAAVDDAGVSADGGDPSDAGQAAPPAIHFFTDRAPTSEVTSMVISDQLRVQVTGLTALTEVTLQYRSGASAAAPGTELASEATFIASSQGVVDTGTMAPVRGTYSGVEPDGLIWSASERPSLDAGTGLDALFTARFEGTGISSTLKRLSTSSEVRIEAVSVNGLVGELYLPASATARLAVITLGGSEGGISAAQSAARRLASFGYPTLALAYFGAPGLPSTLTNIPLEYFEKALTYLDQRPEVLRHTVVLHGISRGAELALLLGSKYSSRVIGVIALAPSSHVWPSVPSGSSPWKLGSAGVPYVPEHAAARPGITQTPNNQTAYILKPVFEQTFAAASSAALNAARIDVERINGPVLAFGGSDDQLWPSCDFAQRIKDRLGSGHQATHQDLITCAPAAGHRVWRLGESTAESMWGGLRGSGSAYFYGGTAAANAHAAREADAQTRTLLARLSMGLK